MQKISRIYVGNYGIDMAWYDGILFDLTAPETGEPTDTIINLENGGGKTTLLSFFFSCFETSQDRFLKHIQNKNHRFHQYFARDGLPGIVLMEWEMPSRVDGGAPYRMVMGQVVAMKSNADVSEVDRVFFSFEANAGLRLESVPAPKLTMAPANTMAEFSRWMHEAQKLAPDFFQTRTQQDWQRHLRDERQVDVEMLQLQVNFSAQEGGIDTGFLTFESEPEFIRKFFDLTLDPERSASVRLAVVNTCDKLRRKPFFQRRLAELETLQGSLTHFDTVAQGYKHEQESQLETLQRGGGLILALEARTRERTATAEAQQRIVIAQEQSATESQQSEKTYAAEEVVLTSLSHRRNVQSADDRLRDANTHHRTAKQTLHHLLAAKARGEILAVESHLAALEAQAAVAAEELEPWRKTVYRHGAILRRAINNEENRLRNDASAAGSAEVAAIANRKTLAEELGTLSIKETRLLGERASMAAAEDAFATTRLQLVKDDLLGSNEETSDAIVRWQAEVIKSQAEEKQCLAAVESLRAQELDWRKKSKVDGEESARLSALVEQRQQFIDAGLSEREALSQLSVMRQAVDAEVADPDSPALTAALERLVQSCDRELSLLDVHIAELRASKTAIEETGVAGNSRDINTVVTWLRQHGVQSARPYNSYISQTIPDADRARALVASNPARFMGVCLASSEFPIAQGLTAPRPQLSSPVTISVTTLDPEVPIADQIVINAADDAAFNIEAAAALLTTLEVRLAAESSQREKLASRQHDALAGKQRLAAYVERFGNGALHTAGADVARFTAESAASQERAAAAELRAAECQDAVTGQQRAAAQFAQAVKDAERHVREIKRFVETHESGHASRLARLEEIRLELATIVERRAEIEVEQERLNDAAKTAYKNKVELEAQAKSLEEERGRLKYYDKAFPAAEHLAENPQTLALLRQLYADAVRTFESEEKDRLGLLHLQLETARGQVTDKKQAFTRDFPGVKMAEIAPYHNANFDALIPDAKAEIDRSQAFALDAEKTHAVAQSQLKDFQKANKPGYAPTAEMEAFSDVELAGRIDRVMDLKSAAENAAQTARRASAHAKELSKEAESDAKAAHGLSAMLRSMLTLPEMILAEPVVLDADISRQANTLVAEHKTTASAVDKARGTAYKAFEDLRTAATSDSLKEVEPEIATQLQRNDFEAACADSQRLLEGIVDRIGTTKASLDGMQADFDAGVGELLNLTNSAITLLNSAANNKKVPVGAPYVGGKSMIKMRARFQDISLDVRRQALQHYLDHLIDTSIVPAKGPELVAEALLRMHGKPLGLQMLKMVPDEALQYVPVDKIQNSGGEGVVMAMFLYLLINQLRSETQAKLKKLGGGPLILDNPFAKATTPTLWKAQRLLAQSMDVQLVFATALPDYNTVGEFSRFIRLRKAGKNTKTGRWHLEAADFKLREPA